MADGLRIWNAAGNLTFDSTLAVGGVLVAIVTVPYAGGIYTFPSYPASMTGVVVSSGYRFYGDPWVQAVYDTALGYPRFTFPSVPSISISQRVGLFLK